VKLAIYTANFGGIDTFHTLADLPKSDLYDRVLFTDDQTCRWRANELADHVFVVPPQANPRLQAKAFKCQLHSLQHHVSIWVDSSAVIPDGEALVRMALEHLPFGLWAHPDRTNIYDELKLSETLPKYQDQVQEMKDMVADYERYGFPVHRGPLYASGVIVRDHRDPVVNAAIARWWREITHWGVTQDQLSLPVALEDVSVSTFPQNLWTNDWVQWAGHNHQR